MTRHRSASGGVEDHIAFEQSPVPSWIFDAESLGFLDVNAAALGLYGYARREFLGMRPTDILPKEDVPAFLTALREAPSDVAVSDRCRHQTKDGRQFLATVFRRPIEFNGRPAFSTMIRVIREPTRADAGFISHDEILQTIFDKIPTMIAMVDDKNRFLAINHEFERVLGCSEEAVLGRNDILEEWLPDPAVRERGIDFVQRADGTWQEFTVMVHGRPIDTIWTNLRLSDGRIISFGQDITERKRAEQTRIETRERLEVSVQDDLERGNQYGLTFRELTVLRLVADGKSDAEISEALAIGLRTAQTHIANILEKMHAASRTEAGVRAIREGIIS